jgi:nucleotide-binding universal stress UspA family protein
MIGIADFRGTAAMYNQILVPVDLTDAELAKPAIAAAVMMARQSGGTMRLINVMPLTPVMLAEYVPPDFEAQQRKSAEEALTIVTGETGLDPDACRAWFARAASTRRFSKRPTR